MKQQINNKTKIINIKGGASTVETVEAVEASEIQEIPKPVELNNTFFINKEYAKNINNEPNNETFTNSVKEASLFISNNKTTLENIKLFNELFKTLQLMPGVKAAGEGSSGFYVRGGSSDQNLILLDEAPVYNASHMLGFFSIFNSDALRDVKLYKGGMGAEFGGRLSSVLDIKMKEGNSKNLSVTAGIGLISSRLTIESPIIKDKGSFIVSGRRTYADYVGRLVGIEALKENKIHKRLLKID